MSDPLQPPAEWAPPTTLAPASAPATELQVAGGPPRRRSKGKVLGSIAGVGALVAAGSFAVVSIAGNDAAGGAASPEEVGTLLATALSNEDALGVIDLLLPGERDTFRDPLIDLVDHLTRLEVLSPDATLEQIGGIDVELSDVAVRSEPTTAADITNIFLSGSATVTVDGEEVPLGELLIDLAFDGDRPDLDAAPETEEFDDVQLTVVERDGRWYLSAFYSAAEQARGETDLDVPTDGVDPVGAGEPELAVDALLAAAADLDIEAILASLDPTEAEALQRYAPLFLDDAEQALDDVEIDLDITGQSYSVDGSGDRRTVHIEALTISGSVPEADIAFDITFTDGCVRGTFNGDDVESCGTDGAELDQAISDLGLVDEESLTGLIDTVRDAFADYEQPGIAVHEVDGQWYVSPLRTGFDALNGVLAALDRNELEDVVDAAADFIDELLFGFGGDFGDFGDESGSAESGMPDEYAALDDCYAAADAAAGVACIVDGVAAGSIDPDIVNPAYTHPECGVAEVYWLDVYSLPDAEFVAMAEGAAPCFLALVAAGDADPYAVPPELIAPQCLEGLNWYNAGDSDYSDRFFDCVTEVTNTL